MNKIINLLTPEAKNRWNQISSNLLNPYNEKLYDRLYKMYQKWISIPQVTVVKCNMFPTTFHKSLTDNKLPAKSTCYQYQNQKIATKTQQQAEIIANLSHKIEKFTDSLPVTAEILFDPLPGSRKMDINVKPSGARRGLHVYLSRLEDYERLTIHELNHLYGTDGYDEIMTFSQPPHPNHWGISLQFMEGITETNAVIEHCFFVTEYLSEKLPNVSSLLLLKFVFIVEYSYSRQLATRVLKFLETHHTQPVYLAEYIIERVCFLERLDDYLDIVGDSLNLKGDAIRKVEKLQEFMHTPQNFPIPDTDDFSYTCISLREIEQES